MATSSVPIAVRAIVSLLFGAVTAAAIGTTHEYDLCAHLLAGWVAGAVLYVAWTWIAVIRMDSKSTQAHATREDPTHFATVLFVVIASLASLVAVGCLLKAGSVSAASIGAVSVATAWLAVHTVFALHYARLYYSGTPGGIGFNEREMPSYTDFAYVAFTIGMAYAVSDTALQSNTIRRTALWHALVSYLLGAVILAVTINVVLDIAN